jgi:hypothetical protein
VPGREGPESIKKLVDVERQRLFNRPGRVVLADPHTDLHGGQHVMAGQVSAVENSLTIGSFRSSLSKTGCR